MDNKLIFASDYMEGAHPAILERLIATNLEKSPGYGTDAYSESARQKIRAACQAPEAGIFFLAGGTQTNATVLDAMLRGWQGVVSAETGHIAAHEAGAVEFGGHKVITLPQTDGKISASSLERCLRSWRDDANRDHMVQPGAVYISQPTEYGTIYSLAELTELHRVCREYSVLLYADGARLAYALACPENDVTLPDLARLCDAFYIGGTKCGALFGEAVVFPRPGVAPHFFTIVKQHGALLAKSRVVGVQFEALFSPVGSTSLYMTIGQQAVALSMQLRSLFVEHLGYQPFIDSPTNQQFYIIPNSHLDALRRHVGFEVWCPVDEGHTACRFVTSWATTEQEIMTLTKELCTE